MTIVFKGKKTKKAKKARKKRVKNSAVRLPNPKFHYPKTERGRPTLYSNRGRPVTKTPREKVFPANQGKGRPVKVSSWTLELFDDKGTFIEALAGQGTKQAATIEAKNFVGKAYKGIGVGKVVLDGPHPLG